MTQVVMIRENGFLREATPQETAVIAASAIVPKANATVGAATLTVADVAPGTLLRRTGSGAAFQDTLPTAVLLTAAFPNVADGQSFSFEYGNYVAFVATIAGGAGVTAVAGSPTTIAASVSGTIVLTRTSATAWTFEILA